jgi:hypothetical protein
MCLILKIALILDSLYIWWLKSSLAHHAYEDSHRVSWDEASILEIESNSRYRKYKELAHMACLTNLISHTSLNISPIWIPHISNEVSNSQGRLIWYDRFFMGFYKI